jgi:hypothetical protein
MAWADGMVGRGQARWAARLSWSLLILRLTALGKARSRRGGSSTVSSSSTAVRRDAVICSGGKGRRRDHLAAHDP